jgi:hypothetical protein
MMSIYALMKAVEWTLVQDRSAYRWVGFKSSEVARRYDVDGTRRAGEEVRHSEESRVVTILCSTLHFVSNSRQAMSALAY